MTTTNIGSYDDEAFLHLKHVTRRSALALSPDGQCIAIVVQGLTSGETAGVEPGEAEPLVAISEEIVGSEVVLVDERTGVVHRPFRDLDTSFWPSWSPDGKWLALLTQRGARRYPRLTLWSVQESASHIFEDARASVHVNFQALRWSSDSSRVVFMGISPSPSEKPLVNYKTTDAPQNDTEMEQSLAVLDLASGQVSTFGSMTRTWGWHLSPDNASVAFLRYTQPPASAINRQSNWRQLVVVNLSSGVERVIGEPQTDNWGCAFSWSPDGRAIAWTAAAHHSETKLYVAEVGDEGNSSSLFEIRLPEGTDFGFYPEGWYPPPAPQWGRTSDTFYVPGQAKLWRFTRDGTMGEAIILPEGTGFDWLANSTAAHDFPRAASVDEAGEVFLFRPREVWKVNTSCGTTTPVWNKEPDAPDLTDCWTERACDKTRNTLYTANSSADGTITLFATNLASGERRIVSMVFEGVGQIESGQIRSLSWELPDGTECSGSLLLPVGWSEGDKPPVVMSVYGDDRGKGRLTAADFHSESCVVDDHLLSDNGYAVFVPDMPQTDEQPAASLVVAGEAAVRALRASGLVDADRIGLMGSSYGGYTVLCLLTGSEIFRIGIASNGSYDQFRSATDGGWGWTETGQGRMRCSLWKNPMRYLENSPLYKLDKLTAPVLLLHGEADEGNLVHGKALFQSLRRLEKPGEMLTYRDCGHAPTSWSIAAQRDWHQRLLAFLQKHLKD